MKVTDEQIIEVFKETRSPSMTAKRLGVSDVTIGVRIRIIRAQGIDLPKSLRPFQREGAARRAGKLGAKAKWSKHGQSKTF